ncbi:zinc ribbon domain-containing protein [Candidatus Poribacteria bacterium]|nr:zinc ribbon domain-containing protein [Candidatus Poribacteria bacterium]
MQCPSCQHENRQSAKFCKVCGTQLPASCPSCQRFELYTINSGVRCHGS